MKITPIHEKRSHTILIIENTPCDLDKIVCILEEHHLNVVVVHGAEEGYKRIKYIQPDLIILDVMQRMKGMQLCRKLKKEESIQNIPVIFFTDSSDADKQKIKGFEAGGADFIVLPVQPEEVLARINVHLSICNARRRLLDHEQCFRDWAECTSDWFWETDELLRITYMSDRFFEAGNIHRSDIMMKPLLEVFQCDDGMTPVLKESMLHYWPFQECVCAIHVPGKEACFVSLGGKPVLGADDYFLGYRGIGKDVTARRHNEERIQYLAYHDDLTELPNRALFNRTLRHALDRSRRYNLCLGVLFLDLDRFKNVNDTLGHESGDILLKEIAQRIKLMLRKCDMVARLGGDEFVILLEDIEKPSNAEVVARKLMTTIVEPIQLMGKPFHITGSIGISIFPDDAHDEQSLMKNADIAMYRAKEQGKNTFQFYSDSMNAYSFERLVIESCLRVALDHQEFMLYYQAKIELETQSVIGMEVLLRWKHPELGMIAPSQFIPIAEETGLILPIGKWVLREACKQNKAWQDAGLPALRVAVNLSPRQFMDSALVDDVASILQETGLEPRYLELEITESMVMSNPQRTVEQLKKLRGMGICIAMDDFGTGYSSLSSLKYFPVDTIKIDRSFINEIPGNNEDVAITKAIIAMGKTLSMTVVAEGVETEQQLQFLQKQACDQMQGYYFCRPIPADSFEQLLRNSFVKKETD